MEVMELTVQELLLLPQLPLWVLMEVMELTVQELLLLLQLPLWVLMEVMELTVQELLLLLQLPLWVLMVGMELTVQELLLLPQLPLWVLMEVMELMVLPQLPLMVLMVQPLLAQVLSADGRENVFFIFLNKSLKFYTLKLLKPHLIFVFVFKRRKEMFDYSNIFLKFCLIRNFLYISLINFFAHKYYIFIICILFFFKHQMFFIQKKTIFENWLTILKGTKCLISFQIFVST
jgi:hypothetical protein